MLFRSMFLSSSRCHKFYHFLLSQHIQGSKISHKSIAARVFKSFDKYDISLVKFMCDRGYATCQKKKLKQYPQDGLVDSISFMLSTAPTPNRAMVNLLLSPF